MSELGIVPTAIEFMDYISVHYACKYLNEKIPYENSAAMLLIEVDGRSDAEVEEEYDAIGNLCMENGAQEVYVADNYTTQERLWNIRRNFGEALILYSKRRSFEDVVVPIAAIPRLAEDIERISRKHDVLIMIDRSYERIPVLTATFTASVNWPEYAAFIKPYRWSYSRLMRPTSPQWNVWLPNTVILCLDALSRNVEAPKKTFPF